MLRLSEYRLVDVTSLRVFKYIFHSNDDEHAFSFDIDLSSLNEISLPEMATSQVECLAFVAGYLYSLISKNLVLINPSLHTG